MSFSNFKVARPCQAILTKTANSSEDRDNKCSDSMGSMNSERTPDTSQKKTPPSLNLAVIIGTHQLQLSVCKLLKKLSELVYSCCKVTGVLQVSGVGMILFQ